MSTATPYYNRAERSTGFYEKTRPEKSHFLSDRASASAFWGVAAILVAMVAAPLFLVGIVPMADFPAHLTRVTLLSHLPLDPLLARAWAIDFRPLPNLAMDVFVPLVAPVVGAEMGLKLFIALGLALWVAGAALIWRGLWREWAWQPLFAVFFATNATFYYGMSNFHFGAGAALTAAGCWLLARRRTPLFLAGMALATLALMFCHLMAVGVLGLLIGGFELGALWRDRAPPARIVRSLAEGAAVFLPVALAWAFLFEHGHETGVEYKWLHNLLALFIYSSNAGAIRYNFVPAAAMFAALGLAWRAGRLQIAVEAIPAVALMIVATLMCPSVALSGSIIHVRLPAVACILILVAGRIVFEPRLAKTALAALLATTLVSGALEGLRWRSGAATIADMRAAAQAHIPVGAHVAAAIVTKDDYALGHAVDLTVLDRKAFVPFMFTTLGQSTVVVKDAYQRIAAKDTIEGAFPLYSDVAPLLGPQRTVLSDEQMKALRPYADMPCDFDYLYVIGHMPEGAPLAPALQPLVAEHGFSLYRIVAPAERRCATRS